MGTCGMLPPPSKIFLCMFYFKALLGRRNDKPKDRYSRLDNEIEKSNQTFIVDQQQQQEVSCTTLKAPTFFWPGINLYIALSKILQKFLHVVETLIFCEFSK